MKQLPLTLKYFYRTTLYWRVYAVIMCPSVHLIVFHNAVFYLDIWWLNLEWQRQRHMIALGLYSFLTPKISAKFQQGHPKRGCQIEVR